jgi:hypothetical protein
VDDLHTDFHGKPPALEDFARQVSGIHFYNSMIVFEKALQPRPSHMKVPPT